MRTELRSIGAALLAGRRAVVALSGGADSAVAAWSVLDGSVRAIHVHHGNPASDALASAASAIAEELEIPLTVRRVEVTGASETAAREARWAELAEALEPDEVVVTGHTKDDQAETVLLNLLRGSGPMGLAGMRQTATIIRPLLGAARSEVRGLAVELSLLFVDDPENESMQHLRNRVRHSLIPRIEAEFNPAITDALARTAAQAAELDPVPAEIRLSDGVARITLGTLRVVPKAVQSTTLRMAIRSVRPPDWPTAAEVARVIEVAQGSVPRAELEGGVVVLRDRTSLRIGALPVAPAPVSLGDGARYGGFGFTVRPSAEALQLGPARARLSAEVDWVVRGATTGDRIAIRGGHKSVWDLLGEVGVPAVFRPSWPVVASDHGVAWVPFVRRAESSTVTDAGYLDVDAHEEIW